MALPEQAYDRKKKPQTPYKPGKPRKSDRGVRADRMAALQQIGAGGSVDASGVQSTPAQKPKKQADDFSPSARAEARRREREDEGGLSRTLGQVASNVQPGSTRTSKILAGALSGAAIGSAIGEEVERTKKRKKRDEDEEQSKKRP